MPTKTRVEDRVSVTGIGWKKPMSIDAAKFQPVSKAILAVLTEEPIKFSELASRVAKRLPGFEGSVSWYTVSVARELEVQGRLVRHSKPVRYAKPGQANKGVLPATAAGKKAAARPRGAIRSA